MTDVNGHDLHPAPGLPGTSTIAIGQKDGRVVLLLDKAAQWVALDTATAFMVAEKIARQCYAIHNGREAPEGEKVLFHAFRAKYTPELRERLVARVKLTMRGLEEQGKPPEYRAQAIVDTMLNMVDV